MVLLGGLEIVAAGYLINRHQKNKRERERIEAERLALEESSYHIFPPSSSSPHPNRHRRSRSERRYDDDRDRRDSEGRRRSRERRRSKERRERRDSEGRRPARPVSTEPVPPLYEGSMRPSKQSVPRPPVAPVPQFQPPPQQPIAQAYTPPPPPPSQPAQTYPPDMKYGWTPNASSSSSSSSSAAGPPTGWPAHWEQSQRPDRSALRPDNESGRGRSNSRVRFDVSGDPQPGERARSWSPPPEYKP